LLVIAVLYFFFDAVQIFQSCSVFISQNLRKQFAAGTAKMQLYIQGQRQRLFVLSVGYFTAVN